MDEPLTFGHGSKQIEAEAARQSRMGDISRPRTAWGQAQYDRAYAEFLRLFTHGK